MFSLLRIMFSFFLSTSVISSNSTPSSGPAFFESRRENWLKIDPDNNLLNESKVSLTPTEFENVYKRLIIEWNPVKQTNHLGLDLVLKIIEDGWKREGLWETAANKPASTENAPQKDKMTETSTLVPNPNKNEL